MTGKEKSSKHKVFHFVYYLHTVSLLYLVHYTQDMHRNTHTHTHTHTSSCKMSLATI